MLRDIAEATETPEAFLSKIFQSLRAADIVRSHRGTTRGYALSRAASEVSLYEVIAATEGPARLHMGGLVAQEVGGPFGGVWSEVEDLVAKRLKATTIQDLIQSS